MMAYRKLIFKLFYASMICFVITLIYYAIRKFEIRKCHIFYITGEIPDSENSGFIFFLLLNANQIPSVKDLQILFQHIKTINGSSKKPYFR